MTDPFHDGERAVQELAGERDKALLNGKIIARAIPAAAAQFVATQEMALLASVDSQGRLWASGVQGSKGFARVSEDLRRVRIAFDPADPATGQFPLAETLTPGARLGMLFIDFATRRRLRVNGHIDERDTDGFWLAVEQAYPNCPKYIQQRTTVPREGVENRAIDVSEGSALSDTLRQWIGAADTFFVASAGPNGLDVSHRGGPPGFVRVHEDALCVPDYRGNSMFNTLGNLQRNPRAGLCFLDFERARQLQLTGEVRLDLAAGDPDGATGGTGRWWQFKPSRWWIAPIPWRYAWRFVEASPFNPRGPMP